MACALINLTVPEAEPAGEAHESENRLGGEEAFLGHPAETHLSHLLFQLASLWLGAHVHSPGGSGTLSRRWPDALIFMVRLEPFRSFLLVKPDPSDTGGPSPSSRDQAITQTIWHLHSHQPHIADEERGAVSEAL